MLDYTVFYLYISDMTATIFDYADDWVIATSHKSMKVTKNTLPEDPAILKEYFRKWVFQSVKDLGVILDSTFRFQKSNMRNNLIEKLCNSKW